MLHGSLSVTRIFQCYRDFSVFDQAFKVVLCCEDTDRNRQLGTTNHERASERCVTTAK